MRADYFDSVRRLLSRQCKTKALHIILEQELPFPQGTFCKRSIQNFEKVIVAIASSSIPQAGLGLFLLSGPSEDGSAPPGSRVATYDGIYFCTRKKQYHIRSDQYQSNYAWEGINPFTGDTVMVDGSSLTSYGPYMNDGLAFGKIYVETITRFLRMLNYFSPMGNNTGLIH